MAEVETVVLPSSLVDDILSYVTLRYPSKSFGYLAAGPDGSQPHEFVGFEDNIRNEERWRQDFESRGRYFVDHPDAGFVATEEESWRVQRHLARRDLHEVAMFHTHRRHPGNFSEIDYELHVSRSAWMWHLVISLRNVTMPQLRAFRTSGRGVCELRLVIAGPAARTRRDSISRAQGDRARRAWRDVLTLDSHGLPRCRDAARVMCAINGIARYPDQYDEHVTLGFLRHAEDRYATYVAPHMTALDGGEFDMGTESARHFCGETPRHRVAVSPFQLSRFAVTNEIYATLDPTHATSPTGRQLPVVGVSWVDAALCAAWVGCRLPTEAEWEFACAAGSPGQWCCTETSLVRHAWYSENADQVRHPAGTREPNVFGLSDMHGNVWEWCQDTYFPDYYARSPMRDPVAADGVSTGLADSPHKVSRGGSFLSLAEMCRTRYRLHDPTAYTASDLGFRLARNWPDNGG
jgi:formylglycine-generating enzyme required for sulfatase activity/proteasome lid subunit RPN8/RPN11